ncbi:metallophosphoesterase family protein [Nitriliruptoraceae bacterium ZYF776]|nr:metallophosphoesterase family protein [Profundirhabdus halotolerans]
MGFTLSRRQLLAKAAVVGATFPAASLLRPDWSLAEEAGRGLAVPMNCELVTVTDTSAIITWFTGDPTQRDAFGRPLPVAAPGRVLLGTGLDVLRYEVVGAHEPTPYHYVEIDGLTPGTTYRFVAESNGLPALPTLLRPDQLLPSPYDPPTIDTSNLGIFTTLTPPPGRELLRFAWCNDVHFGELISGILTDAVGGDRGFPPGFPVDPDDPYWRFMGHAAIDEAKARGARFMLVNGDLTNEAEPDTVAEVRAALDRFGRLGGGRRLDNGDFEVTPDTEPAYWVTRGNHDRAHAGERYAGGWPLGDGELFDTFAPAFADSWAPGARTSRFAVVARDGDAAWRFVGLDSNDGSRTGVLAGEQLEYLEAQLEAATEPTIVALHHPAGDLNNLIALPPGGAGLASDDARAFRSVLARHLDRVVGVYQGHTHRNNRTVSLNTGATPFFEGGATKEYPGGYTIVRLYEEGYMVNFYKTAAPEARAWSERSRGEYLGLYPYYTLGGLSDRNWVHRTDARRTDGAAGPPPGAPPSPGQPGGGPTIPDTAPIDARPEPRGTTSPPGAARETPAGSTPPAREPLPVTGGGRSGLLVGAAAIAAAAALRARRAASEDPRG